ncbi:MAG: sigma-70 family RNA polymerase sigma factor [candidate division Zixibacteria bacterium]|nr:sigma-70 family RNA polymerase sigma factor [candidate division Zixibacteria bacterium]
MADTKREENQRDRVSREGSDVSDARLIEAAQNGDSRSFGLLIRRHQKRLFRFIYGLTGSFDQAEDIVQEAFVKAYGAIKTFRTQYDFYPWLSTIARNHAYNVIRREEKSESLDKLTEAGFVETSPELGPLEALIAREGDRRFWQALNALPVKYRTVFVLRHLEDMDYSAIASYLKIPPGTVDSRLHRARKMLLERLKDLLSAD